MPSWLTILCALLAVHLFALEALAERAKRTGETTLYRPPLGLRILLGAAIISMVYGAGAVALSKELRRACQSSSEWFRGPDVGFAGRRKLSHLAA
jgi:hypothetical protein